MTLWNRLRVTKTFIQLVGNPQRTDLIFKMIDVSASDPDQRPVQAIEQFVLADEGFRKMHEEGYMPKPPSFEELIEMPEGSFGRALYDHLKRFNLDLELFPRYEPKRPIEYLSLRVFQDHDLWHVLLGYSVDIEDELALQAFGVSQYNSPIGAMIIAGGFLHLLQKDPARAVRALKKVVDGYARGKEARFMLAVRLHELLPRPLEEVRAECGLRDAAAFAS